MKTKTLHRVFEMAKPHKKTIIIVTILSLLISIAEMVKPYLIKIVIDEYLTLGVYQKGIVTIGMIGASYIGIVILGNIIDFIARTTTNMMGENIIYTMRNRLFKYTQEANIPFHDRTSAGKLFVRITNDVEDVSTLFKDVLTTFFKDVILIVAIILLIIIGITITMARYRSTGTAIPTAEVAFFVIEEGFQAGNIMLEGLYPREDPFEYEFTIANTDGTITAETSIDYTINMVITTNLPLDIKMYRKTSNGGNYSELKDRLVGVTDLELVELVDFLNGYRLKMREIGDTWTTYVRKIKIKDGNFTFSQAQTDTYKLSATFPIEYSDTEEFEGMIDNVAITVDAKQKI